MRVWAPAALSKCSFVQCVPCSKSKQYFAILKPVLFLLKLLKKTLLPTMQIDHLQFSRKFRCVMLVVSGGSISLVPLVSSRDEEQATEGLVSSLLSQNYFLFKLVVFDPNRHWLKWHYVRQFIQFHAASSAATKGFIECIQLIFTSTLQVLKTDFDV